MQSTQTKKQYQNSVARKWTYGLAVEVTGSIWSVKTNEYITMIGFRRSRLIETLNFSEIPREPGNSPSNNRPLGKITVKQQMSFDWKLGAHHQISGEGSGHILCWIFLVALELQDTF